MSEAKKYRCLVASRILFSRLVEYAVFWGVAGLVRQPWSQALGRKGVGMSLEISGSVGRWEKGAKNLQAR